MKILLECPDAYGNFIFQKDTVWNIKFDSYPSQYCHFTVLDIISPDPSQPFDEWNW